MKRVLIVGAESTGKTTLAVALAEHYQTTWVPEFGRFYTEARRPRGEWWTSDEFTFIATEQVRMEDAMERTSAISESHPRQCSRWPQGARTTCMY